MSELALSQFIEQNEGANIPLKITTREGHTVDTSSDQWHLPYSIRTHATLDLSTIINRGLRWITKRYIQEKFQTTSTHAGYSAFQDIRRELLRFQHTSGLLDTISATEIKDKLISLVEHRISQARSKHRLWALYRPIQWYIWCAENYPELGFCSAYAMELDSMIIPGNPTGEAVRMEDPDSGPLHRSLELPLLIKAMREDKSQALEHLQQKVAVALSIDKYCMAARNTAAEMQRNNGADLSFISHIPEDQHLYTNDLKKLGLSPSILCSTRNCRKKIKRKKHQEKYRLACS